MYLHDLIDDGDVIRDLLAIRGFHDLYLAGGVVRDALLDRRTLDLDIACRGLLDDVAAYYENTGLKVFTRPDYHALHVTRGHYTLTFTHLRRDEPDGRAKKATLQEDALRRDFTVNALYFELLPTGELRLIDRVGGLNDLHRGRLRPVSPEHFFDDPSRVVRALRYRQRLDFTFSSSFLEDMRTHRWTEETFTGSIGRVYSELDRTVLGDFLEAIRSLGLQALWPMGAEGPWRDTVDYFLDHIGRFPTDPLLEGIADDRFQSARKKYLNFLSRYSKLDRKPGPDLLHLFGRTGEAELWRYKRLLDDPLIERYLVHRDRIEHLITGNDLLERGYSPGPELGRTLDALRARLLADPSLDRERLLPTPKEGT